MTNTESRYIRINAGYEVKDKKLQEVINVFKWGKINEVHTTDIKGNFVIEYEMHPSFKIEYLKIVNYQESFCYKSLIEAIK